MFDRIINNSIDAERRRSHHQRMNAYGGVQALAETTKGDPGLSAPQIVQALEEDIVFGRVHPRERLIENDLMDRFSAKRHVVRQALAELERIGLAERLPGRSVSVKDLKPADVEQVYAMRELLETAAANWMRLPADPDLVAELTKLQRDHDAAASCNDIRSVFRINIMFHDVLFSNCGNRYLAEQIELFGKKAHAVRSFSITRAENLKGAGRDHWEMIEALQQGSRATLVSICRDHIQVSKNAYIEAYKSRFPFTPESL